MVQDLTRCEYVHHDGPMSTTAPATTAQPVTHLDPNGEYVEVLVPDATGLCAPVVVRLTTSEVEHIYNTLRATQLGADAMGDL